MKLHNGLTKTKETFTPEDPKNVRMYVCGPTVYDRAHIGNARAVVVFDTLFRVLQAEYGKNHVTYVRNITDVDDKINNKAKELNKTIKAITEQTTAQFHSDMSALNCQLPTIEPRATEHISDMIAMIEKLIENQCAYAAEGHVLFDVSANSHYGHLSRRSQKEMVAGARVEVAPYKKNPSDFVLWKPSDESKGEPGWESPWGYGRPGWHIECSAMSTKYLKKTFDIHGGGADLQFPHHENEIAQSTCAFPGSKFARYWVHNGFLTVEGEKMSKSLGNFITVHDLLEQGVKGEVIRLALLSTHYRKPLDWSKKGLKDAIKVLDYLYYALVYNSILEKENNADINVPTYKETEDHARSLFDAFLAALENDLNTPLAITQLRELSSLAVSSPKETQESYIKYIKKAGNLLGILQYDREEWLRFSIKDLTDNEKENIEELIQARLTARAEKNWAEADRIRDALSSMGIALKDNPDGTTDWEKQ